MSAFKDTPNAPAPKFLYEQMSDDDLRELRAAFELDIANATTPVTVAFGRGRIALIDAVLAERGKADCGD